MDGVYFYFILRIFQKLIVKPLLNKYLPKLCRRDKDTITFLESFGPIIELHKKVYTTMSDPSIPRKDESGTLSLQYQDNIISALLENVTMFFIYEPYLRNYYHAKSILTALEQNELNLFFTEVYTKGECSGHNLEVYIYIYI